MTTFNSSFDWDTNLPPSISSLDENDFLLLLQKQYPAVNAGDLPITSSPLSKGKSPVGANAQSLAKFSLRASNSPLSTDSSPSPPSANDEGPGSGSSDNKHKRSDSGDDEPHKRKASADDFEDDIGGQPSAKSQHTDPKLKKSSNNARRKSSGGEKDESRLLKRKEQNRAAQRAFRERKEKHVKDLEDKVAQLEAKTETQATENEHLRDMLSRLQSENMMLKQTSFTFSMPSASNDNNNNNNNNNNKPSAQDRQGSSTSVFPNTGAVPGPSSVPASGGSSVRTASTHDSPSSLFENFDGLSALQNTEAPLASSSTSASSPNNNDNSTPGHDQDTIAYFGSTGPFTTISSNPMFTSYRDPMLSMNAFASFGGWDGDVSMSGTSSAQESSTTALEGLFGDQFGEQFSGLIPFGGEFLNTPSNGSPSGQSAATRLSPVAHNKPKPLGEHLSTTCPKTKEDIERLVATGGKSTFGTPPPIMDETLHHSISGGDSAGGAPGRQPDYDAAVDQAFGMAPKKPYNDNCNIDELCLEMQRKARCSYASSSGLQ